MPETPSLAAAQPAENFGQGLGENLLSLIGGRSGMGTWTGLPPSVGAPVSGALLGAGLGLLYGGAQRFNGWLKDEPAEERPWWQQPWALGLGAGATLGAVSGQLQPTNPGGLRAQQLEEALRKGANVKYASSMSSLISVILRDPSLPEHEKRRLIAAIERANPQQRQRLLSALMAGTLTSGLAYGILGLGALGSAALGGIVGFIARNLTPGRTQYV